jgi:hypothetical protein
MQKFEDVLTWFVVAVMMLIGRVNKKANAEAKTSPHQGI